MLLAPILEDKLKTISCSYKRLVLKVLTYLDGYVTIFDILKNVDNPRTKHCINQHKT